MLEWSITVVAGAPRDKSPEKIIALTLRVHRKADIQGSPDRVLYQFDDNVARARERFVPPHAMHLPSAFVKRGSFVSGVDQQRTLVCSGDGKTSVSRKADG
jgi:hypothetical protein